MKTTFAPTDTHESEVFFNQAIELLRGNHVPEAMKRFEAALQISPNNAAYLSHYGLCVAIAQKDYEAALKLCERAVKMDPKNPVNRVNLGKVYRLKGDNTTAYQVFLQAWKADKTHPAAASELTRMGIRRPPILAFLPREHWLNVQLGMLRSKITRSFNGK